MAQVLMPRRAPRQGEAIAQALSIVGSVMGISGAAKAQQRAEQEFGLAQQVKQAQLEELQAGQEERSALAKGILTPSKQSALLAAGKELKDVKQGAPGAFQLLEPVIDERSGEQIGTRPTGRFVSIGERATGITPFQREEIRLKGEKLDVEREKIAATKGQKTLDKAEKGVSKIADKFEKSGIPDMLPVLERIDNILIGEGLPKGVDTVDFKADVPGFGRAAGLLPDVLVSIAGEDLRQDVNSLVNQLLKARSGGAVTPQEAARLAAEIKGANTDRALVRGLRNLKTTLQNKMQNTLAGAPRESLALYRERNPGVIDSALFQERRPPQALAAGAEPRQRSAKPLVGVTNTLDNIIRQREAIGQVGSADQLPQ
jgi:hypothetical protein